MLILEHIRYVTYGTEPPVQKCTVRLMYRSSTFHLSKGGAEIGL